MFFFLFLFFFEIPCLPEKGFAFLFGFIANTPDKMKRIRELYTFLGRELALSVRILSDLDADQGMVTVAVAPIRLATATTMVDDPRRGACRVYGTLENNRPVVQSWCCETKRRV